MYIYTDIFLIIPCMAIVKSMNFSHELRQKYCKFLYRIRIYVYNK